MKWASLVARMDRKNPVKKVFVAKPLTSRKRGKLRWFDSVK